MIRDDLLSLLADINNLPIATAFLDEICIAKPLHTNSGNPIISN